jgi:hypothetical protein
VYIIREKGRGRRANTSFIKYRPKPGELIPWIEKLDELNALNESGSITGDPEIIRKAWEDIEQYATRFVWMCLTDI